MKTVYITHTVQTNHDGEAWALQWVDDIQTNTIQIQVDCLFPPSMQGWAGVWKALFEHISVDVLLKHISFASDTQPHDLDLALLAFDHEYLLKTDENYQKKIEQVLKFADFNE